ncbi:uncharacterized protein M6G45_008815 [Spheniscus humboldti]
MAHQSHPCWSCQWPDSWLLRGFFPGLSPPLQDVLRIAVVAVVFAAISEWGLIFPICQSEKLRIRGELWRWLSAYTCRLVCIASILAGTAGILWMREEGPSIAIILPEIALTYMIVVTFLVSATVTFQPTKLIQLKSKTAQCTMGYAAPGGVVSVVLTTSFLIKNIHHRTVRGDAPGTTQGFVTLRPKLVHDM